MCPTWPREPGIYALVFYVPDSLLLHVGRLGARCLPPGWYLYVGSARGPGGLAARLGRHLRREKRQHWHVDRLTRHVMPLAVVLSTRPSAQECAWVERLLALPGVEVPWPGFGSADCRKCPAHLLFWGSVDWHELLRVLADDAPTLYGVTGPYGGTLIAVPPLGW